MSSIDYLDSLNREIRRLSKIRLDLKKKIQSQCLHRNIVRTYHSPKFSLRSVIDAGDVVSPSNVKIKIICKDCGKVLNGRRG
jgi:hypothetical protein